MDFAQVVAQAVPTSSAPAAPEGAPAAGAGTPATVSPMDKLNQLFPPEQPAQQTGQPATANGVSAQPGAVVAPGTPNPAEQFTAQLKQENARLREEMSRGQQAQVQAALEKTTAALEKITQIQTNPALTPEQQKAAIDAEFAELNGSSPKATIKKWMGEDVNSLQKTVEALTQRLNAIEPAVQKVDRFSTRDENISRLYTSGATEVADQTFRSGMLHPDNVAEVQQQFYANETDATKIYKDPGFYNALLMNAKLRAAKGFQPVLAQSQADMVAQGQVAQAGGGFAPNGRPAGGNVAPPLSPEQQFKQALLGTRKSFGELLNQNQFR